MSDSTQAETVANTPNTQLVRFNFFEFQFLPLKEHGNLTTNQILLKIVDAILDQRKKGNIIIYDRFKNRPNEPKRQLYINHVSYEPTERRLKFSMALIRDGKLPLLKPTGSIDLVPFNKEIGDFTELTHFFIDMNRPKAIVCTEFNDNGPRMTDIQYYFRAMSTDHLHLSRALNTSMFMEKNIEDTIENLNGVFDFDMKIEAKKYSEMDLDTKGFLAEWGTLLTKLQPEFIRVEAFFRRKGRKDNTPNRNVGVIKNLKHLLTRLSNTNNADAFDKFVINYSDAEGNEKKFDLFDTKSEISLLLDLTKTRKTVDIYKALKPHLDEFLKARYNA